MDARKEGESRLRALMTEAMSGNDQAYETFLGELIRHLRAYFRRRLVRWPDSAEDLVQETLVALHNQRHTYDPGQPLTPWLHAIAKYKLVDWWRRYAVEEALSDPLGDDDLPGTEDSGAVDAHLDIEELLQHLPDRQRLPIVFVKLEGMSIAEASRMTGMSESAVKVGIHRGLKALSALIRSTT